MFIHTIHSDTLINSRTALLWPCVELFAEKNIDIVISENVNNSILTCLLVINRLVISDSNINRINKILQQVYFYIAYILIIMLMYKYLLPL